MSELERDGNARCSALWVASREVAFTRTFCWRSNPFAETYVLTESVVLAGLRGAVLVLSRLEYTFTTCSSARVDRRSVGHTGYIVTQRRDQSTKGKRSAAQELLHHDVVWSRGSSLNERESERDGGEAAEGVSARGTGSVTSPSQADHHFSPLHVAAE